MMRLFEKFDFRRESMTGTKSEMSMGTESRYMRMAMDTKRCGHIKNPDGYGMRTGDCGDTVEFFIAVENGCIASVIFNTDGCLNTNACANTVASLSEGKRIEDAWDISDADVIAYLQALPPEEHHCAELAVGAFYLALADYQQVRRNPWKKTYR